MFSSKLRKFFCISKVPDLKQFMQQERKFIQIRHEQKIYNNLKGLKFYLKTYGCQMNQSDSEIINSILQQHSLKQVQDIKDSNLCIINTCAIRENAEQKIWRFLQDIRYLKREKKKQGQKFYIGVVGCMAERLKQKLVEKEKYVDLIVGPDSYKDLPRLVDYLNSSLNQTSDNYAINTQLSIDETYSDITPIRTEGVKAMISIMRGCANICSFCIVPFVRGVERSRSVDSIVQEVQQLFQQGIREITLLGQNVNSYLDQSQDVYTKHQNAEGFDENFKARDKKGLRFAQLLQILAQNFPEVRFRFTSPHPKDFPDQVIQVIKQYPNICSQLHMPAQSGSNQILQKMNRKYTKESYLKLVDKVQKEMPLVSLSSDFIVGFCDETEEDFKHTLEIVDKCKFDQCFNFAYSMREKTPASRTLQDNVPQDIKQQRLERLIELFKRHQLENMQKLIGSYQLVLVETEDLKKIEKKQKFVGKADNGKMTIFFKPDNIDIMPGEYIKVKIYKVTQITLFGQFVEKSSIQKFAQESNNQPYFYQLNQNIMNFAEEMHKKVSELENQIINIDVSLQQNQQQIDKIEKVFFSLRENDIDMEQIKDQIKKVKNGIQKTRKEVQNINSAQLNEISQYMRPPPVIKFFLEGLFVLLNGQILTWKRITQEMNNGSFIDRVLKIDASQIEHKNFTQFQKEYASDERWDLSVLNKASQAIAPLALLITELYQQKLLYQKLDKLKQDINKIKQEQKQKQKQYEDIVKNREELLKKKYEFQKQLENVQKDIFKDQKDIAQKQKAWILRALEKGVQCDLINQDMINFLQTQKNNLDEKVQKLQNLQAEQERVYQDALQDNQRLRNEKIKKESEYQNKELNKIRGSLNLSMVETQNLRQQLLKQRGENQSLSNDLENLKKFQKSQNEKLVSEFENQKKELEQKLEVITYNIKETQLQHTHTISEYEKKTIHYQKEISYLMTENQEKDAKLTKQKKQITQLEQDLQNVQKLYLDQQNLVKTMEGIIKNLREKNQAQQKKFQDDLLQIQKREKFRKKDNVEKQGISVKNLLCYDKAIQTTNLENQNVFYEQQTKPINIVQTPPQQKVSFHVWKDMDSYSKNFDERKSQISENQMKNSSSQFFYNEKNQITSHKSMNNRSHQRSKSQNVEKIEEFFQLIQLSSKPFFRIQM